MPSEKTTRILLSKTDMVKEEISMLSETEAWKIIYSVHESKVEDKRLQICFTGFSATKKDEMSVLAVNKAFKVVGIVTKKLDFLCGGDNAGPKKIEAAEAQGVQLISEVQFLRLIETGEIPS